MTNESPEEKSIRKTEETIDLASKIESDRLMLNKRRHAAAKSLQKHFSQQPDGVIVASISNGMITVDVTEFGSMGELLFADKLVRKYVGEAFENVILNAQKSHQEPTSDGAA